MYSFLLPCLHTETNRRLAREASLRELARILTAREIAVFQLAVRGLRTKDIADALHVPAGTLKIHVYHIYQSFASLPADG
jgi:DNA-binding NarL/FixJ family response regulator